MPIDYMVYDITYRDYISFKTEQEARDWIKTMVEEYPDAYEKDFILYKRERLP